MAPALIRPLLEPLLPQGIDMRWFANPEEAVEIAPDVDIAWVDQFSLNDAHLAARAATKARWFNTMLAGLNNIPLDFAVERSILVTNGSGLNSATVADYALLGVLTLAKRFDTIIRAFDRQEWLPAAPGMGELEGSHALIIGMGTIGNAIAARLAACDVQVTGVRRKADPERGVMGASDWRAQLGRFDWIILAAPSTDDTRAMIGAEEIAAMKPTAGIVNIARGDLIDQPALISALTEKRIAGAFLDVTYPEPLPADDPLWKAPNCIITMHLSGRSQTSMFRRGAERFARNLGAWLRDEPLESIVDLSQGY
jgi:phosphoglycerate dehydrogenase-like enzyme